MAKLHAPYRDLADPRAFQKFLGGAGALANRGDRAEAYDYDHNVRKLDFVSRDPTGMIRQVVVALVVWELLVIKGTGEGQGFSPKHLWRELQAAMHQAIFDFGRRCSNDGVLPDRYSLK